MTTAFYICAAAGIILLMGAAYILGWSNGREAGRLGGYDEAAGECRRRCAHAYSGQVQDRRGAHRCVL